MRSETNLTPTHARSLANHRNRPGIDKCVAGGGFDYEVEGEGHGLGGLRNRIAVEVTNHRRVELRERFGIDCIAVTAQSSHTGGSLMSQRECAGSNRPPLSIPAEEPVSIVPSEHRRIGSPVVPQSAISAAVAITSPAPFELPCFSLSRWRRASVTSQLLLILKHPASGVGQPANSVVRREESLFPAALLPFCAGVPAIGVGHPARYTTCSLSGLAFDPQRSSVAPFQSRAAVVAQPESPVPDMRPAEARSRKRDKPEGVTHGFQVSLYKIEPYASAAARNLLSSDDCRLALFDEVEESGPQMPLVSKPLSFACRAERLARARSCPDRTIVGPTGATQGEAMHSDSCEEVALSKSSKLIWSDIFNAPFVNDAGRDVATSDQFAQPSRGEGVDLVVVSDAQPIAAIANRIVERVGHGLDLDRLRNAKISHEAVTFLVREGADFAEALGICAARSGCDNYTHEAKTKLSIVVASRIMLNVETLNRIDRALPQGRIPLVVYTQGQIAHLPIVSHSPLPIRNEASGELLTRWHRRATLENSIDGLHGDAEHQRQQLWRCIFPAEMTGADHAAVIIPQIIDGARRGAVPRFHLPNPRSQSPATRAAGGEIRRRVTLAVDGAATGADDAGRGGDGQRGVYVGEARAHTTPAFAVGRVEAQDCIVTAPAVARSIEAASSSVGRNAPRLTLLMMLRSRPTRAPISLSVSLFFSI